MFWRGQNFSWLATDQGFSGHLTGIKKVVFEKILIKKFQSDVSLINRD
jgi:hypothetical protein